jgi:hypothetical protein
VLRFKGLGCGVCVVRFRVEGCSVLGLGVQSLGYRV